MLLIVTTCTIATHLMPGVQVQPVGDYLTAYNLLDGHDLTGSTENTSQCEEILNTVCDQKQTIHHKKFTGTSFVFLAQIRIYCIKSMALWNDQLLTHQCCYFHV